MKKMQKKFFCYELFEKALSSKSMQAIDFARLSGIHPGTISHWRIVQDIKKRKFKDAIEQILGVKYEDLCISEPPILEYDINKTNKKIYIDRFTGEEIKPLSNTEPVDTTHYESEEYDHDKSWPIVGSTRGGAWLETIESGYAGSGEGLTDAPDVKDANGYALRVLGDSMEPEFTEGGIVLVSPNSVFVNGDFAVVIIESRLGDRRESCLKKVFKHDGYITLHSLNDKYKDVDIPDGEVIAIHKVILSRRTLEKKYI